MEARQTNISAEYEPAIVNRRKSPRAPVSLDAKLGRGGLDRTLCRITDLSRHGACLRSYSALKKDMVIWLTLPGLGQVVATIKWANDFEAGCQFREPLAAHIFDLLAEVAAA
jgi:hypothetical protein